MDSEVFAQRVEAEWEHIKDRPSTLTDAELSRVKGFFTAPEYQQVDGRVATELSEIAAENIAFSRWLNATRNRKSRLAIDQ